MFCCQELDRVARTFSLGLANVLAIAAPDRIAVGGGVAKMGDELFSRIRRYTEEYAFVADAGHYGIVESRRMDDAKRDKKIKAKRKEGKKMEKTMNIEGMMCGHCEARVKKCLEALPEVDQAVVSHEAGTAVVTLTAELGDDVLKKTVEDQDYKVISIR